jgi:replicative DNA helicase
MAAANRRLRMQIQETIKLLGDDDVPAAYAKIESLRRPRSLFKEPADIFDHATVAEDFDVTKIEVPYPTLGRATGGIAPAELWMFAARLGQGKTWVMTRFLARAAATGYNCAYLSLEMTAAAIARRIYVHLAGHDRRLISQLMDEDVYEQKRAIDELRERTPGEIRILDPSHGRINTTSSVASVAHDFEFVVVDHAGLLATSDGKRAIEDWRVQATISNVLREITLESGTPIAAAVQVNREGAGSSSRRPPGTDKLAGSDALGQDADVVVMAKRTSDRTMVMSAEKTRNGPSLRWFTEFDPAQGRFDEITKERANEMIMLDNDTMGDMD